MERKLWGLFTGAQVTVIAVTALLCLAIPGGLWASGIQFSLVSLYDAKSKQVAKLGAGGAIKVTNGVDPLVVDGNVSEAADLVRFFVGVTPADGCTKLVTAPAGKGLVIKRLFINPESDPLPNDVIVFRITPSAPCNTGALIGAVNVLDKSLISLDLGPGVAVPAGSSVWAYIGPLLGTVGSVSLHTMGTGYFVPAAAIPAATAVTVQNRGR